MIIALVHFEAVDAVYFCSCTFFFQYAVDIGPHEVVPAFEGLLKTFCYYFSYSNFCFDFHIARFYNCRYNFLMFGYLMIVLGH